MKKLIILSIGTIVLMANLSSCKKGENDPFLSLRSRKARLTGEWTITKENGTSTSTSGVGTFTTTSTYNGAIYSSTYTYITTSSGIGMTIISNNIYTSSYTFEKDGTFKMEKVYTSPVSTETIEGTWAFLGKSKTAELKNKEAIILTTLKVTETENGVSTTETNTGFDESMIMLIDQLKNKEIIFINESSYTDSNGDTGSSKTTTVLTAK